MSPDGSITLSPALSDTFNLATKIAFDSRLERGDGAIGYCADYHDYLNNVIYRGKRVPQWEVIEVVESGFDLGAELDDLFTDALHHGSWTDIRIATNVIIDMFANDKPDCQLLDDMPDCQLLDDMPDCQLLDDMPYCKQVFGYGGHEIGCSCNDCFDSYLNSLSYEELYDNSID